MNACFHAFLHLVSSPLPSGNRSTKLGNTYIIKYKLILAALIDSEQILSFEAQLCTRRECSALHSLHVHSCASMLNICSEYIHIVSVLYQRNEL